MTSYMFAQYIILMMTLHNVQCHPKLKPKSWAGVEKEKISANPDNFKPKFSLRSKKINTHTLCLCPLIRKLQAFEILKWAQGSQWRKQRTSDFTHEKQLIFSQLWNTSFFYNFTAVKNSFYKICIIFNQYFPVFHYFVYNKISYLQNLLPAPFSLPLLCHYCCFKTCRLVVKYEFLYTKTDSYYEFWHLRHSYLAVQMRENLRKPVITTNSHLVGILVSALWLPQCTVKSV